MTLVTRNHVKLTLEGARAVLEAAKRRAEGIHIPLVLAVVDDGGHLLAFERMDGAKPSSITIAIIKAQAAAVRRAPTGPVLTGEQMNLPVSFGLAIASPAQQTPLRGGVPLIVDGQVVGAIGASAGTEEQDLDAARAGAAAIERV
jgi:glc operon protein GlcG